MVNKFDKEKTKEKIEQLRKELPRQQCSFCPNPLFDMVVSGDTEPYEIDGKPACRECFLKLEGEELEKHPMGYVPQRIKIF